MMTQRQEHIKELRAKLMALTPEQRQILANRGITATIEGRQLSLHNTILLHLQLANPTIVGGYQQWKQAGRQVKKGEHGAMIWFPVGQKNEEGEVSADRFFTATVFDISQVE